MSGCDCGGPCFYCGRALPRRRHEHDHFPIPRRHGGWETVPTCWECHTLKDRADAFARVVHDALGARHLQVDDALYRAFEAGLPEGGSRYCGPRDSIPLVLGLLFELWSDLDGDDMPPWGDVESGITVLAGLVRRLVVECTTPEARIWIARYFAGYLDRFDEALQEGRVT